MSSIPKRKLIKKQRPQPKPSPLQSTQPQSHQSIFEKLKSINPSVKEQAVTILANLHISMKEFLEPEFSRELVNVLYQANNALVNQTLFAMANLCQIEPMLTRMLFDNGLDKALIHLPSSTNPQLLKPILVFFITICQTLPKKHHYLLQGIRSSLDPTHLLKTPSLCLQFLFRTYNQTQQKHSLSEPVITTIANIFKTSQSITERSYAVAVMAKELQGNKEVEEILANYMTELLVCIDLGKEYVMNFGAEGGNQKKETMGGSDGNDNHHDQQQQQPHQHMQQDHPHKKPKTRILTAADREKLKFFNQTIQGIEILLELLLDVLEKDDAEDQEDQEDIDDEGEDAAEEGMTEEKGTDNNDNNKNASSSSSSLSSLSLKPLILQFITQNMPIFPKFLSLSSTTVPDTQNIVYLFYHLLLHIDRHLQSTGSNTQQTLTEINQLVQVSLENLFQSIQGSRDEESAVSFEQYQTLVQCLEIGLGMLLRNKAVGVEEGWLVRFSKAHMMQPEIFTSLRLLQQLKPCWLIMLQLFSKTLNPQKNPTITPTLNHTLGQILKHLIISLPYTQLQEFRCQVIDTLFDVYSNEKFDQAFVQLGFIELLETVAKRGQYAAHKGNANSKVKGGKTKTKRQEKFVSDVVKDVKRFLEYKRKMIHV